MFKDMYVATTGFLAAQRRMDTITNNLANINTPAFKSDQLVFESYLPKNRNNPTGVSTPHAPNPDFMRQAEYVVASEQFTDFSPGVVHDTGNSLDVALKGDGFLAVMTSEGERFTRNGAMKVGASGELATADGHPVLSDKNQSIIIKDGEVTIDEEGNVWIRRDANSEADPNREETMEGAPTGKKYMGRIKLVDFTKPYKLTKEGNGLFSSKAPDETITNPNTKVLQGHVEGSNVNMISQMTDMIQNQRLTEAYQKAIQESDNMTSQSLIQVGRP